MTDYRDPIHRDPIHRDPVYDTLGDPLRKDSAPEGYGSGSLWGWVIGFLVAAGILLIAYGGSEMRVAQYEPLPPPTRITPAPSPAPAPQISAPVPGGLPPSPAR